MQETISPSDAIRWRALALSSMERLRRIMKAYERTLGKAKRDDLHWVMWQMDLIHKLEVELVRLQGREEA